MRVAFSLRCGALPLATLCFCVSALRSYALMYVEALVCIFIQNSSAGCAGEAALNASFRRFHCQIIAHLANFNTLPRGTQLNAAQKS